MLKICKDVCSTFAPHYQISLCSQGGIPNLSPLQFEAS